MGGIFPRGVPVGTIEGTADVQGQWLKSYWLKPAVEPASVTHVLVETAAGPPDLSSLWASDSASAGADGAVRGPGS
jgi:cell shape-determining protein MreC